MSHILLIAADDMADLCVRIVALLAPERVSIHTDLGVFPDPSEAVVGLVVLSPKALSDPAIADFVRSCRSRLVPLVPVVEDLDAYDFSTVTIPDLEPLNAAGWQPGDGAAILRAVRGYLGREAFPRQQRVFISYRRQDGGKVAQRIYKYLRDHGYDAFLDVFQIEAGAPVQDRIVEAISDKDFVLLIDTPKARQSSWVRAEIIEALNRRIPVRALAVDQRDPYPLLPDVQRLTWTAGNSRMLGQVRDFVSRGIGAAASFDVRCRRVLEGIAAARGWRLQEDDRRRVLLGGGKRALIEYEHALPSLERLHRLYKSYNVRRRGPAILISGDQAIAEPTSEAIAWARGRAPLHVVALHDLVSLLDVLMP